MTGAAGRSLRQGSPGKALLLKDGLMSQPRQCDCLRGLAKGRKKPPLPMLRGHRSAPKHLPAATPMIKSLCPFSSSGNEKSSPRGVSQAHPSGPACAHPPGTDLVKRCSEHLHCRTNKPPSSTTIKMLLSGCKSVRPARFLIIHPAFRL